jgi:hypothetical protein
LWLLVVLLLLVVATSGARAEVRALVVGVDRYHELPDLEGAVADALDMSAALRGAGVSVTLLLEEEVTRERFFAAWAETVAGSGPDDVILLAFAGHGIQIPDRDGDEPDGLDEAFVLPAFRVGVRDDVNLIIDDEIDRLVREAAPRLVIVVADTCHSGTLTRAVDDRAEFRAPRFVPRSVYGGLDDDLPPLPSPMTGPAAMPADNSVLFASVPEHQVMHEVLIDGQPRGALSWSFARGIEGAAVGGEDGGVTVRDLAAYVPEKVRLLSQGRQTPVVTARGRMELGLFAPLEVVAVATAELAPAAAPGTPPPPAAEAPLRLAVDGPQAAAGADTLARLEGVAVVDDPAAADLIWHLPSGDVLSSQGDVAARLGPAREPRVLQGVVAKWQLLRALEAHIDGTLGARLRPDDRLYRDGDRLALEVASTWPGRLVLFDLTADGSVILILPRPGQEAPAIGPQRPLEVPLRAGPPFGADHLVAVRTEDAATAARLVELLRSAHGRPLAMAGVDGFLVALQSAAALPTGVYSAP